MKNQILLALTLGLFNFASQAAVISKNEVSLEILTDSRSMTLYVFDLDLPLESKCEANCARDWIPFLVTERNEEALPEGLSTFSRSNGDVQYAFQQKPLYFYRHDLKAGDVLGSEVNGLWHVVPLSAETPAPIPFVEVAGCKESDYVDGTLDASVGTTGASYTPRCLRLKIGSNLNIAASNSHPLQGMSAINGVENPFFKMGNSHNTPQSRTLNTVGFFGYFCTRHGDASGNGMAGAIQVVE